ncbi:MAG: hypothetical protein KAG61_12660 [Bacteriovoracaceae bacterium]|nr:hypothetical protein [Bacteriovoracaceae bacterium]
MLKQGIQLFSQNRFEEAKVFFESITLGQLNLDDSISYFHYLLAVYKHVNQKEIMHVTIRRFFKYLDENANYRLLYSEISEYCKTELNLDTSSTRELERLDSELLSFGWKSSVQVGQVQQAKNYSACLMENYNTNRNFSLMSEHLREREKWFRSDPCSIRWGLLACLYKGDIEAFDKILNEAMLRTFKGKKIWIRELMNELQGPDSHQGLLHESLEYSLLGLNIQEKCEALDDRKRIVNQLYRQLLCYPNDFRIIKAIIEYGLAIKSKRISEQAKQIVVTNPTLFSHPKSIRKQFDSLIVAVDALEDTFEEEIELDDSYDFATDLFSMNGLHHSSDGRDERGFEFLKSIGADDLAQGVKSNLLKKLEHEEHIVDHTSSKEEISLIARDLLGELEYFSKLYCLGLKTDTHGPVDDQKIASYLRHGGIKDIDQNYSDIAVAFYEMGLYSSSLAVIEQVEKSSFYSEELDARIEHSYLKIEVLKALKQYAKAVALIEEMLCTWPLVNREQLCFNYLAAELYLAMNNRGRSLNHFLVVSSIDPTYRLVKQRLDEFE